MEERTIFKTPDLKFSDQEIQAFAQKIKVDGYVEIRNIFNPWVLEEAVNYVGERNKDSDSGYLSLRAEDMAQSVFVKIKDSDEFKNFMDRLRDAAGLPIPENNSIHCVVRSIDGSKNVNKKASDKYHFDAYDLTASMPLVIPREKNRNTGDFVMFLRRRTTSSGLFKTLFYKSIFQNSHFQKIAKSDLFFRFFRGKVLHTKPGSLYVFFGFRTYHGNRAIDKGLSRATALFHYSNPLGASRIIKNIEARRKRPQATA